MKRRGVDAPSGHALAAALAAALTVASTATAAAQPALVATAGRAGLAPPGAEPPVAGRTLRLGLAAPAGTPGALPDPEHHRAFLRLAPPRPPAGADEGAACDGAARALVAAAGQRTGARDLSVPLLASFHADGTVALQDPQFRLGTAAVAAVLRLPGAALAAAADPLRSLLAVAVEGSEAVHLIDLAARRSLPPVRTGTRPGALLADPASGWLWAGAAEGGGTAVAALDLEVAAPAVRARLAVGPGPHALALDPARRSVLAGAADGTLALLEGGGPEPAVGARRAGDGKPVRAVAFAAAARAFLAAHDDALLAFDAVTLEPRFRLPLGTPPAALLALEGGTLAVALSAAGDRLTVVDVARGAVAREAETGGAVAELAALDGLLALRRAGAAELALLPTAWLANPRAPAPALATHPAGTAALPGLGPLPLLAPVGGGGGVLVGNPGDGRAFVQMPGMAAPGAALPLPGAPVSGLLLVEQRLRRTGRDRLETTQPAPAPGRWQLVVARAGGGGLCHEFEVGNPPAAASNAAAPAFRAAFARVADEPGGWELALQAAPPRAALRLYLIGGSWQAPLAEATDETGAHRSRVRLPHPGRYAVAATGPEGVVVAVADAAP